MVNNTFKQPPRQDNIREDIIFNNNLTPEYIEKLYYQERPKFQIHLEECDNNKVIEKIVTPFYLLSEDNDKSKYIYFELGVDEIQSKVFCWYVEEYYEGIEKKISEVLIYEKDKRKEL